MNICLYRFLYKIIIMVQRSRGHSPEVFSDKPRLISDPLHEGLAHRFERKVTVVLSGCRRSIIDKVREKQSEGDGNRHTFLVIDDFETLLHQLKIIQATESLPILLIGPHIDGRKNNNADTQIEAIERIKKEIVGLTVVAVNEENIQDEREVRISRSIIPPPNFEDDNPTGSLVLGSEGEPIEDLDDHLNDMVRMREAGADHIIYPDELLNGSGLERTVNALASDTIARGPIKPIICRVRNGVVEEVSRDQILKAKGTMDEFSGPYNNHMTLTGHFDAMYNAYRKMLLMGGHHILGNKIVDLGCGTSYPMALLIGKIMIPQFKATMEVEQKIQRGERISIEELEGMVRKPTAILSVDRSVEMLRQTKDQFEKLKRRDVALRGNLRNAYLSADISELTVDTLRSKGFDDLDTIIVSMLIHWQPNDQKESFVQHIVDLMPAGARYVAIEEWEQSINPSPYISLELMRNIERDLRPIPMEDYYGMLASAGLREIEDAFAIEPIDRNHSYYVKAFEKS